MKPVLPTLALALAAAPCLAAGVIQDGQPNANWFSVGATFGLKIDARFKYQNGGNPAAAGPSTGGGINRDYSDGFVHTDVSGDASGQTWNWGYQFSSQASGNQILMHSGSASASGSMKEDTQPGVDIAFGHDMGKAPGGVWGLQGAFDFTTVSIHSSAPLIGSGTTLIDAYTYNGVGGPPTAPYSGSFNGPGSLLSDTPARTTAQQLVLITGARKLDAQVFTLRLGPYYDLSITHYLSARVGGGLVLAVANMDYSFNETVMSGGVPVSSDSGEIQGAEFRTGFYAEAKLLAAVSEHARLFGGLEFENLGTFAQAAGSGRAELAMGGTMNLMFGLEWDF